MFVGSDLRCGVDKYRKNEIGRLSVRYRADCVCATVLMVAESRSLSSSGEHPKLGSLGFPGLD
jgi:hypothetical protein